MYTFVKCMHPPVQDMVASDPCGISSCFLDPFKTSEAQSGNTKWLME